MRVLRLLITSLLFSRVGAFALSLLRRRSLVRLNAGGFEWEDPGEVFDQGVENPFKNPDLMKGGEDGMKIDPARLLGPRLNGSNLYLIGMMGSGKSSVGNKVARRESLVLDSNQQILRQTVRLNFTPPQPVTA